MGFADPGFDLVRLRAVFQFNRDRSINLKSRNLTQIRFKRNNATSRRKIAVHFSIAIGNVNMDRLPLQTPQFFWSDVGQAQMWAAQHYFFDRPNTHVTSGGLGPMGYALPAAIGVQIGKPEEEVWCVTGDGGFQMTLEELSILVEERLPVKIALFNNNFLGMVRQWQQLFFDKRYSGVKMWNPDFVKLGEAYSIPSMRVKDVDDVRRSIDWARDIDGPAMIEFVVEAEENVFPMVPPGASLHETIESAEDVAPKMQQVAVAAGSDAGGV